MMERYDMDVKKIICHQTESKKKKSIWSPENESKPRTQLSSGTIAPIEVEDSLFRIIDHGM